MKKKLLELIINILKLIRLYQFVPILKRYEKKYVFPLSLKKWPKRIPSEMLQNGVQYDPSGYYNNDLYISKMGKVRSFLFGKEVLYGTLLNGRTEYDLSYTVDHGKVTVPLCLPGKKFRDLSIVTDSKKIKLEILECSKWKYFTFPEKCKSVKISSKESSIILGEPFRHKQVSKKSSRPKCVVLVIVDSLSKLAIERYKETPLMPNTLRFFEGGRSFSNHHAQGEWSLPNNASILTGLYTSNHGLYRPETIVNITKPDDVTFCKKDDDKCSIEFKKETPLLSEVFRNDGYLTFGANGNYRIHPFYQFTRGFDRFLFYANEFKDREMVNEAVEQIKAFPNRNHFLYLNLMSLHSTSIPAWSFSSEVNCNLENRARLKGTGKIIRPYEHSMVMRYNIALKEIDNHLKQLYDLLDSLYEKDEIVFCLSADHGVTYLAKDEYLLAEALTNTPLFVRSPGIKPGDDHSLVQSVDIFPNLLHLCNIDMPKSKTDGKLWSVLGENERDYVLTESIYESKYELRIRDKTFIYSLKCFIENDRVNLKGVSKKLWKISKEDKYEKKEIGYQNQYFEEFDKIAMKHISSIKEL
ncbi:MAG: sulfatase-like hydrolase/transferase [Candidatus Scalindua sp.]|nr:sulfatase-like hydrolase/transferase [Candidatus Scalindua sp.]